MKKINLIGKKGEKVTTFKVTEKQFFDMVFSKERQMYFDIIEIQTKSGFVTYLAQR